MEEVIDYSNTAFVAGLNEVQKIAVLEVEGPVLILAGAGSGKTRVITHRIAHLIRDRQVSPEAVLAVTFTNKASKEMLERVKHLIQEESRGLWVTTFHSMGAKILRKHPEALGFDKNFSIYGPSEQKTLVKAIMKDLNIDPKRYQVKTLLSYISNFKGDNIHPEEAHKEVNDQNIVKVYDKFQSSLKEANAMDFDDLQFHLLTLFEDHPEILEIYQERFEYILVDEYQDTNQIQYDLVKLLSKKHGNVCVVGDEDQSIYSWRGANIQNIINFTSDYSTPDQEVKRYELNINYRCPGNCLRAANLLISNNTQRTTDKQSMIPHKDDGDMLPYFLGFDGHDEARDVCRTILNLQDEGVNLSTAVILYRTHAQSRVMEQQFIREGIPYQIFGGHRFFERKEIKDVLAYLSLLHNAKDSEALYRIINVPARGIGAATLTKLRSFAENHRIPPLLALDGIDTVGAGVQKKLLGFYNFYLEFLDFFHENHSLVDLTRFLLEKTDYINYLRSKDEHERLENIDELINTMAEYEENEENPTLEGYLEKTALVAAIDGFEEDSGLVTMMTLHNAKGLEFDYVFMVGLEEELFPHANSLEDANLLEEERRLCYVGVTRTMKELYLSSARSRYIHGVEKYQVPSRFLREIGDEFIMKV
ncbi:MAG: UvrD-helicase domain-containing protein [Candidatus Cloacimonetes bacterium]|nr:UvrD-helicase domain-containing protein [Candidatus Cloacimonadota bacterium]